jgi:hypothetical protein
MEELVMESKKEYLRRILKVTKDDVWYSEMDTFMREYNNFISAFNFEEIRDGEIEKIFVEFHNKGITPARLVELQKGKEELKKQLFYYSKKTKEYYETEIKGKRYEEICRTNRAKEIQIELMDLARNHSLTGNLKDLSHFLSQLDKWWITFINELYVVVDLIFSGEYEDEFIRVNEFDKVVDKEISYYRKRVAKYAKSFNHSEYYYVGKNDNPYKNIFLYCLNAYIRNFYPINIITMQPGSVDKLLKMIKPEQKEKYTLKDVAKAYAMMSNETLDKSYEKIKQQFRKSPFMQELKKGRTYEFDCIEIPLATYIYYSKKNHVEPKFSKPFDTYDKFIVHFYAPLLRANMYGEYDKLRAFNRYADFINNEFRKFTGTVNDAYLDTWLEELFLSSLHLKGRCIRGVNIESVIEGKIPY